ncbi:hypothetical protein H6P81_003758 [Aristolochia fimbriata]|uniref:AAA+ ATPase domain-containing protein n=1 Tax=Aristolochia fimbriata TaxID=158543 RepID=A0AAV7FGE7_ARIFI|nr:hypothetical protein H6P81_003758 [Aristolochia fimbriata]
MEYSSAKSALSMAASVAASAVLLRTFANDLFPYQLQTYISSKLETYFARFSSEMTIAIEDSCGFAVNQLHAAVELYLGSKSFPSTRRLRASKLENDSSISVTIDRDQEVFDLFEGIRLKWRTSSRQVETGIGSTTYSESYGNGPVPVVRLFLLSFNKKHKVKVMDSYLPFVLNRAKVLKEGDQLKIFSASYGCSADAWSSVNLKHAATIDKVAMEPDLKSSLVADLDRFLSRKDYYLKVGKAWKRGYLLYGPPGTGKSTLIAAIAKYVNFNIYELQLSNFTTDFELRGLLLSITNRSILIIEDIDCVKCTSDRRAGYGGRTVDSSVSLSALLNLIDGLWSCMGEERIIIFTTNHKENLDPALLRPGRMDMHIRMSYCTPSSFKVLAYNYLGIHDHPLFADVSAQLREVSVAPAHIAEELMKYDDPEPSLKGLIEFLHLKKMEDQQALDEGDEHNRVDEAQLGEEFEEHMSEMQMI